MATDGCIVVVGGTAGIGKELARYYAGTGRETIITGAWRPTAGSASPPRSVARRAGSGSTWPDRRRSATRCRRSARSRYLAIVAIQRDDNTIRDFDIDRAMELVTLKLVGYRRGGPRPPRPACCPTARSSCSAARRRTGRIPGSTTVSTVNGGIAGLARTLAWELAPIRVNAIHPGIVGDSPYWHGKPPAVLEGHLSKTITKRLATMADIVDGDPVPAREPVRGRGRPRGRQRPDDVLSMAS